MLNYYYSEGIILNAIDTGEGDRFFVIYTKKYGLLRLFAKSVRFEKSKLKGSLIPFSYSIISFVEGKDFYRLIDAQNKQQIEINNQNFENVKLFIKLCSFLERMIIGEGEDKQLWNFLLSTFNFILNSEKRLLSADLFELVFQLKLLLLLGYVPEVLNQNQEINQTMINLINNFPQIFHQELSFEQIKIQEPMVELINRSIAASHL